MSTCSDSVFFGWDADGKELTAVVGGYEYINSGGYVFHGPLVAIFQGKDGWYGVVESNMEGVFQRERVRGRLLKQDQVAIQENEQVYP